MNKFSVLVSTLFGIGKLTKAPGTWGSVFALLVYFLLPQSFINNYFGLGMVILFGSLISVYLTSNAEKVLGHDDGCIVIDEFFGFFVGIFMIKRTILSGIVLFLLFRFFDIRKPYPINLLQKLPKGWGIMADDIVAGIFSNLIFVISLEIIRRVLWIF